MGRAEAEAKAEAVQLVRTLPCDEESWLKARWGRLRCCRKYRECYVELRSSALLIYKPQDVGRTADDALKLVGIPTGEHVELVSLRTAFVGPLVRKLTVSVTKPDRSGSVDIRFPDKKSFDLWLLKMRELAGLRHTTLADFEIERHVGRGASGRVYLVHDRETKEPLALKVIEKKSVYKSTQSYRHALDERIVLALGTQNPFILNMRYAFQNRDRLFLVTEFCGGGDLYDFVRNRSRPLEESKARYIAAEILLGIEHIHRMGAVYRDLKLENILLDEEGHIRLADFGLSKLLTSRNEAPGPLLENGEAPRLGRTRTFCGTPEYIAPEMLTGKSYGTSVDFWEFGIVLYEILCGRTPFYCRGGSEIYERIWQAPVCYPEDMSDDVQDLLKGLLERNVKMRLGNRDGGIAEVKSHPWFSAIDWDDLYAMRPRPDSVAQEIRQMKGGKDEQDSCAPSVTSTASKRKRQRAQDRAMNVLKRDISNDVKAMGMATPRMARSGDGIVAERAPGGSRAPRVVPISRAQRKSRTIAGYSFVGRVPEASPEVYRNPAAGYERANVFDALDAEECFGGSKVSCPSETPRVSVGAPPGPVAVAGTPAAPARRLVRRARLLRARALRAGGHLGTMITRVGMAVGKRRK